MASPLAVVLLAALAALLAPSASAEDLVGPGMVPNDNGGTYPHCMNVWQAPRTCLCPWPQPADGVICPIPGP
jgi:hypothetical protein